MKLPSPAASAADASVMARPGVVNRPGSVGRGSRVVMVMVCSSFTTMVSIPNVSADASDNRMVRSNDAFTASASIAAPLWNLTPARSLISQVNGSTWVASVASHGSGLKLAGDRRKRFSDIPD